MNVKNNAVRRRNAKEQAFGQRRAENLLALQLQEFHRKYKRAQEQKAAK